MSEKRYYWLKLKKDFFKRHDIKIIESMPNGKDYVLFYLKMLLESIDHEGSLRFNETIPYNENMLSVVTNTNIDIVRSAMKVFIELNMIEVCEDSTIYMLEVNKMLGSETAVAERVRKSREKKELLLQSNNSVTNCNTEIDIEIDIEKERESNNVLPAPDEDKIQNLWIRTIGRNPKQPEFEETERLVQKYGHKKVYDTFKKAALRNIKSLQYLLDNVDTDFNLLTYTQKNNSTVGEPRPAAYKILD